MWSLQIVNPLGKISLRKSLIFVATLLVTLFTYLTVMSSTTYAATPDATWKNGSITYKGNTYTGPTQAKDGDGHGLPAGTILYSYLTPPVPFGTQTLSVIYFSAGSSATAADTGIFVTYTRGPTGGLSNKSSNTTVTFKDATKPADPTQTNTDTSGPVSTCKIDGVGWIICPVTNFLSTGMDWVFKVLSGFIEVKPLTATATNDNVMLNTWNVMRNFANVVFVIVFVIIIYSQLTSTGVSNYGIKRMLPRLIIGAILVNISYWICAIAIDLSNILGYSFQDLFLTLRDNILGNGGNGWQFISWQSVASFVMAGGAVGGAAALTFVSASVSLSAFSVVGVMLLLLPVLAGALLTILVVLLILAARQAIITVFVIIAPLAFVAYLMPSTEKWFDKWRDVFVTMMVFFPAFSLVFGGAQFAGFAIIHNAADINTVILGLAVQIAPLAITPLLLKFSGSLLGRIAGIVNNRQKGFVDRARNFSKDRLDANRARQMARTRQMAKDGTLRPRHAMRRTALLMDNQKRLREGMKSVNETDATSLFGDSSTGRTLHAAEHLSNQTKERLESDVKAHLQQEINVRGSELHLSNVKLEASKTHLESETTETDKQMENYKSGRVAITGELSNIITGIRADIDKVATNGISKQRATAVINQNYAKRLISDEALQYLAGGVAGKQGADIALANATSSQVEDYNKNVAAAKAINTHFKLSVEDKFKHANGEVVSKTIDGVTRQFTSADVFTREAAVEDTVKAAPYSFGRQIIERSGEASFAGYRETIAAAMEAGNWEGKGAFFDGETRDTVKQGRANEAYIKQRAAEFLVNGKLSAESAVNHHKSSLQTYIDVAKEMRSGTITVPDDKYAAGYKDAAGHGVLATALRSVKENAHFARTDVRMKGRVGDRKDALEEIDNTF